MYFSRDFTISTRRLLRQLFDPRSPNLLIVKVGKHPLLLTASTLNEKQQPNNKNHKGR